MIKKDFKQKYFLYCNKCELKLAQEENKHYIYKIIKLWK